jgi:uncharacterized protein YcbK (DUF882 family)
MKLTEHFHLSEFQSRDLAAFPEEVKTNLQELAENLEVLRAHIGQPIIITSGYRSPAHNEREGGASNSMHLTGKAADIKVAGMSARVLHSQIEMLIKYGKMKEGGLGLYATWVHYDIRGSRARWNKP